MTVNKKYLLCALTTEPSVGFTDDLYGKCSDCERKIRYRPHAPKNVIRICVECFDKRFAGQEVTVETTEETVRELKNVFTKN